MGLLEEMESHANRTAGAAEVWASEQEDAFTEALDGQLRSHRPRAGRVEEEVRATRSVELVAQRRKMEGHMRLQSKAVKQQQVREEGGGEGRVVGGLAGGRRGGAKRRGRVHSRGGVERSRIE